MCLRADGELVRGLRPPQAQATASVVVEKKEEEGGPKQARIIKAVDLIKITKSVLLKATL